MKISLNWLKDYVEFKIKPQALAHKLTMAGLEVEKITAVNNDTVFELEITPNRPDCLNFLGIAREISAILNTPLKIPKPAHVKFPKTKCPIAITDKGGCWRYVGTVIKGACVAESPKWLKDYLAAIGLRSINNIVDITNFVLMETGQPLHAFDYDKLTGGKIIVRRAKETEVIMALDEREYKLDSSILVIADAQRPVAMAGIMGGTETAVTGKTRNILLESAYFDPVLIRRAARKLGVSSDSSYRFERGVDFNSVDLGARRAISLILELAGGKIEAANDVVMVKENKSLNKIKVSFPEINQLLGASVSLGTCKAILIKLGCHVSSLSSALPSAKLKDILIVSPPSFRRDIKATVDISEEIARIIGYDQLPVSLPSVRMSSMETAKDFLYKRAVREVLVAQGLNEVVSWTMLSRKVLEKTNLADLKAVCVRNPLTVEQEIMRPSLLPSLLSAVGNNLNKGQRDLKFFETGKIYQTDGEKETLGIIMLGRQTRDWRRAKGEVDFYDMKGALERLFERWGISDYSVELGTDLIFEEGRQGRLVMGGQVLGKLGAVSKEILDRWDIKREDVFYAEISLVGVFSRMAAGRRYQPIPEYPSITRDVSLAVKSEISFQKIKELVLNSGAEHLGAVDFIEEYRGEKIASGYRGLTLSLTYQSTERTLSDEEVNKSHELIRQNLIKTVQAIPR